MKAHASTTWGYVDFSAVTTAASDDNLRVYHYGCAVSVPLTMKKRSICPTCKRPIEQCTCWGEMKEARNER